jgi:hypothetical protein
VGSHNLDNPGGQADRAAPMTRLRRLDAQTCRCLFKAALDPDGGRIKIEKAPCEPAQFAAAHPRSERQRGDRMERMAIEFGKNVHHLRGRQD